MNKSEKKIYILFSFISLVFIIFTTNYLSLFDIIYEANQTDAISYSEIAKKSPNINLDSDIIIQHVAQRFLIPYTIGFIANFLNIDFLKLEQIHYCTLKRIYYLRDKYHHHRPYLHIWY